MWTELSDTAKDCGVKPEHIEAISKTLLLYINKKLSNIKRLNNQI